MAQRLQTRSLSEFSILEVFFLFLSTFLYSKLVCASKSAGLLIGAQGDKKPTALNAGSHPA